MFEDKWWKELWTNVETLPGRKSKLQSEILHSPGFSSRFPRIFKETGDSSGSQRRSPQFLRPRYQSQGSRQTNHRWLRQTSLSVWIDLIGALIKYKRKSAGNRVSEARSIPCCGHNKRDRRQDYISFITSWIPLRLWVNATEFYRPLGRGSFPPSPGLEFHSSFFVHCYWWDFCLLSFSFWYLPLLYL